MFKPKLHLLYPKVVLLIPNSITQLVYENITFKKDLNYGSYEITLGALTVGTHKREVHDINKQISHYFPASYVLVNTTDVALCEEGYEDPDATYGIEDYQEPRKFKKIEEDELELPDVLKRVIFNGID